MAFRIVSLFILKLSLPSCALTPSKALKKEASRRSAPKLDVDELGRSAPQLDVDELGRSAPQLDVDELDAKRLDVDELDAKRMGGRVGVNVDMDEGLDASVDVDDGANVEVDADMEANVDAESESEKDPIVNFLPEQRLKMHRKKFEKDIVANMTISPKKLARGEVLGLKLNVDTDFEPVLISKIKKKGIVQDYNEANPDAALHVGDQIIGINGISWHHNSKRFVERIKGQYQSVRNKNSSHPFLVLYAQRPRVQKEVRTQLQRDDLHYQQYAKDFTAKIQMPPWLVDNNMNKAMGWQLKHENWYEPITVHKIKHRGILGRHNEEKPDEQLLSGDEIVAVNGVNWHNNATEFLERLLKKFESTRKVPKGKNRTLNLDIRRPRKVQEEYDKINPYEQVEDNVTTKYVVGLDMPKTLPKGTTQALLMGWQLKYEDDNAPPIVDKIRSRGMIARHNAQYPDNEIKVGDRVTRVNGVNWHNNSELFFGRIGKQLAKAIKHYHGDSSEVTFGLERTELKTVTRKKKADDDEDEDEDNPNSAANIKKAELAAATALLKKVDSPTKAEMRRIKTRLEGLTSAWNKLHPTDTIDIDLQVLVDSIELFMEGNGTAGGGSSPIRLASRKSATSPARAAKAAEQLQNAIWQEAPKEAPKKQDDDDDVIGAED